MSISKETEKYVAERPILKHCIRRGWANYSAVARQIMNDLEINNFNAVLVAIRRYAEQASEMETDDLLYVVRNSTLDIKTGINVYILEKGAKVPEHNIHVMKGSDFVTVITNEKLKVEKGLIKKHEGVAEVIIKSPERIEETAGVVSYFYSLLAEHGVNIIETMSSFTETVFVVEKEDVEKCFKIFGRVTS